MKYLIPAIVAVVSLCATEALACNPVLQLRAEPVYAAPVVYQPVVAAIEVQPVAYAYAAPVRLQVVDNHCRQELRADRRAQRQQQRHCGQPLRNMAKAILPPY